MMTGIGEVAQKIKNLEVQGAENIAREAARAIEGLIGGSRAKTKAAFIKELRDAGEALKNTRPSAVALPNAVNELVAHAEGIDGDLGAVKKKAAQFARAYVANISNSVKRIGWFGAKKIRPGAKILLHCHSSSAIAVLRQAHEMKKDFEVVCTETRPWGQGFVTAREVADLGVKTTLIVDSAVATVMPHIDFVLVGADTVARNGDLVNKIGTHGIAIIAKKFGKPVYSATSTLKFGGVATGADVPIEERDAGEVLGHEKIGRAKVWNPVFDSTPAELIESYITERGFLSPKEINRKE